LASQFGEYDNTSLPAGVDEELGEEPQNPPTVSTFIKRARKSRAKQVLLDERGLASNPRLYRGPLSVAAQQVRLPLYRCQAVYPNRLLDIPGTTSTERKASRQKGFRNRQRRRFPLRGELGWGRIQRMNGSFWHDTWLCSADGDI